MCRYALLDFSLHVFSFYSFPIFDTWHPAGLFYVSPCVIQSPSTSLAPLDSFSNLPYSPTGSRYRDPCYSICFFPHTKNALMLFFLFLPSTPLFSVPHILEVTFRPHLSVTSIAQGWDHVTAFPFPLKMCALIWTSPEFRDVWNLGFWLECFSVPRVNIWELTEAVCGLGSQVWRMNITKNWGKKIWAFLQIN